MNWPELAWMSVCLTPSANESWTICCPANRCRLEAAIYVTKTTHNVNQTSNTSATTAATMKVKTLKNHKRKWAKTSFCIEQFWGFLYCCLSVTQFVFLNHGHCWKLNCRIEAQNLKQNRKGGSKSIVAQKDAFNSFVVTTALNKTWNFVNFNSIWS